MPNTVHLGNLDRLKITGRGVMFLPPLINAVSRPVACNAAQTTSAGKSAAPTQMTRRYDLTRF